MYYAAIRTKKDSLSHSKGPWRVHKYLRKLNGRYFYPDASRTNTEAGIRTYYHVRTNKERSGEHTPDVIELERLQEVNSDSWFSNWRHSSMPIYEINNHGKTVAVYYHEYQIGKIERYARDNEEKVKEMVRNLTRGLFWK